LSEPPRATDPAPRLTIELLEELHEQWVRNGAPITTALNPGLSDDEIDSLTAPLEIVMPDEARLWWKWHNGVPYGSPSACWCGFVEYARLALAVKIVERNREEADMQVKFAREYDPTTPHDPSEWWRPSWMAITQRAGGAPIVFDCAVARDATTPIDVVDGEMKGIYPSPAAQSFGELITAWIEMFTTGAWSFDKTAGEWLFDDTRMPAHLYKSPLV
jgi:cell wall assembly regulator SMI1